MSTIVLRRFIEADLDKNEVFKVIKPTRFRGPNDDVAKRYNPGEEVTLKGLSKKDAYFSGNVVYPEDYDKVMADIKAKREIQVAAKDAQESQANVLTGKSNKK